MIRQFGRALVVVAVLLILIAQVQLVEEAEATRANAALYGGRAP